MSQHNFCNSGQNVIFRVWGLLCLLCFLKLPSTSNKQTKPRTFLFPLISYLNIYSCGIFHIKGEVGKGLKHLSSTNHFFSAHPPFPFFFGGAPTEHPCIDNSHPWDSNQKTDSHNCLTKLALRTIWCDHPRPSERKEEERSSCHFASAFLPFIFSDAISRFWFFNAILFLLRYIDASTTTAHTNL